MEIVINLLLATICIGQQCHPVLIGPNTPVGKFPLIHVSTHLPGYGGDVLAFAEDAHNGSIYAIHRPWLGLPVQRRLAHLRQKKENPKARKMTSGCVNVDYHVYDQLAKCKNCTLKIVAK